jgi:hypothetical protein
LNCIEKLKEFKCSCGSSHADLKIKEFGELPESKKSEFDWYDSNKDFILYCETCETFNHIYTDTI